jgi:magnesium chelatase family protein
MAIRIRAPLNQDVIPGRIEVEITSRFQIPAFTVVGLADREVAEARERVRAAIEACGWEFPQRKIVINLSPADIRKSGTGLDLPMALAVLSDSMPAHPSLSLCAWGELGLDGRVKSAGHVLRTLYAAWESGCDVVLISKDDRQAALNAFSLLKQASFNKGWGPAPRLVLLEKLSDWRNTLKSGPCASSLQIIGNASLATEPSEMLALPAVLAQAVGLAISGFHHLYLAGPRGSGKSTAVEAFSLLLPELEPKERITRALLQELAPTSSPSGRVIRVGQTVRPQALVGSLRATELRPGSVSLAHGGVLLADELPEWDRDSIESLREPLERGSVSLTRVDRSVELPARFLLAGTGNLCPCGGEPESWLDPDRLTSEETNRCRCLPTLRNRYLMRVSGPILDRFDLVVPARSRALQKDRVEISELREKSHRARELLKRRWGTEPGLLSRSESESALRSLPKIASDPLMSEANSLRTRHKLFRVALTLAAWYGKEHPEPAHLREARFFRVQNLDRF